MDQSTLSIVLPAKNESIGLSSLIPILIKLYPEAEILVIDDGSTDNTVNISQQLGAKVISHPYSIGNGGAIKTGALNAQGENIVFMDADGQHNPEDINRLLEKMKEGYAMVIGARQIDTHASLLRRFGNSFYNHLASIMTGHKIDDLTSGFRIVKAKHFKKILYLLPNGFSYPTTSTMAFFRSALPVAYIPIKAGQRVGKSHIRIFRDGLRFFIIILKIGSLFSPMRLFLPISAALFSSGLGYYAYTFINDHRFTNMSALLFSTSVITFLMGILSEQISSLHYKNMEK
jgi:glycosyltransferase involved in cell wall biosynthesis